MKNITKIISGFAILAIFFGVMGPLGVSAQTLKQKDETAKAKYQQAQQQYLKEVDFYKSARQNFQNARNKYQQLKNAENQKALEIATKNYLEKAVTSLIKRLETIKNWATNQRAIPESERQTIIVEIDQDIAWLQARQQKIQTASGTAIKEEAKSVRTYWETHRVRIKRITGEILAARINFLIAKAENFSAKVASKIEELKADGKDTTNLETWLADFNRKLALAKEKYTTAKTSFQAIKGEPGFDPVTELAQANQLFQQGNQFVKEANQYIRQAHTQLVQIVKEIKKMGSAEIQEVTP